MTVELEIGDSGDEVRAVQNALRQLQYLKGKADGIYGPLTAKAVKAFALNYGIDADGDRVTADLALLIQDLAKNPPETSGGAATTPPAAPSAGASPANGVAKIDHQKKGPGMVTGTITVHGHTYHFRSGTKSLFSTPQGTYRVTKHRQSRPEKAFSRDGVGFSFLIEDPARPGSDAFYDPRAGRDRRYLRIHPDGGAAGTAGCIGILGDGATMIAFRKDLNAEIDAHGGVFTLVVE